MKIYTIGTSSGTHPIAGSHHVSTAIEINDSVYFIDAGECCGYSAHLYGVDLLKTRAIFISHPHMDHVGGLGNLLWYVRKMNYYEKRYDFLHDEIKIFAPTQDIFDATMLLLKNTEGNFNTDWDHTFSLVNEKMLYADENITVTAVANHHIPPKDGVAQSYSFIVKAEGKTLVFSGDIRLEDFDAVLPEKCDAFFVETGHHRIEEICVGIKRLGKKVDKLFFTHNGVYVMADKNAAKRDLKLAFGENGYICSDGENYEL